MSKAVILSDEICEIAALVKAGKKVKAKRQMRAVLDNGQGELLKVMGRCAATLQAYPYAVAVDKLRAAYRATTNQAYRAVIIACVPEQDGGQHIRKVETRYEQAAPNRWPNDLTTRVDTKSGKRKKKSKRAQRQAEQNTKATQYVTERGGIVEGPQLADRDDRAKADQIYGSGFDYDKAAVHALYGLPCLLCRCERSAAAKDGGDSGLCENCATPWRTGLAPLAKDYTRADVLEARCAWLVKHFPRPRGVLVAEWRAAIGTGDREIIEAWISDRTAERPTCDKCLSRSGVTHLETDDDGTPVTTSALVCADCRKQAEADAENLAGPNAADGRNDSCDQCGGPGAPFHLCDRCDKQADADAAMQAKAAAADAEPGGCDGCGSLRQVRDGLCVECRKIMDEVENDLSDDIDAEISARSTELVGV